MTPQQTDFRAQARAALEAGRFVEAEHAARALLQSTPDADAWDLLSCALREQGRFEDAATAADEALRLSPNAPAPLLHRGLALNQIGRAEEALRDFDALIALGGRASWLWLNRGLALAALGRDADAEAAYADGIKRWPLDKDLHAALANTRWLSGAGETFTRDYEAAIAQRPDDYALLVSCADLLRRAGFTERAEALLREGLAHAPDHASTLSVLGMLLTEADRCDEAITFLERAIVVAPEAQAIRAAYVATLLRLARPEHALGEITAVQARHPFNQEWICYQSMAYRQLGDPRYRWLCDYELMVQSYDLPAPTGYASIGAFNQALAASLEKLHVRAAHPLDQTLRGGSQTTRSLVAVNDAVIQSYLQTLDAPIRAYMALMRDPDHPWSGRKTSEYKLAGVWSVKLKANGYHVNHLHPDGWISSAYYVALPAAVTRGDSQEGWIKFGEPRWPTPGCTVEKVVQPQVGRLVLFPSYLWHGTIPFSAGERLTAPFDVVPA